jgi:prepilin-type N-terminal cleavage/methylation domain-containing protein
MKATGSGDNWASSALGRGFTMVELLVVIVILSVLIALLLPAIGGAVRSSRNAAVSAEINQLAQALADFKSKYGDYPPSRVVLTEGGDYSAFFQGTTTYSLGTPGAVDQSDQQLVIRSIAALRRLYPRVTLSTTPINPPLGTNPGQFFDYNGNGVNDAATGKFPFVVLQGHECLVFFLGGVPAVTTVAGREQFSVTGTSRNPANPFVDAQHATTRLGPFFEFKADRLVDEDRDGFPGYVDSLGTGRVYAYFSAYAGGGYDPNDVNFDAGHPLAESDDTGTLSPIGLKFQVKFPVAGGQVATSPAPNPYTTTPTNPARGAGLVAWHNPSSFQLVSAGGDEMYGVGGLYAPTAKAPLPLDATSTLPPNDVAIRVREKDNLTNFHINTLD